ncbi:IS6 family transposase [Neorhizobium galegae]|uniref:IS6 family transposase n=1 Tax=Neorhizobium galegae TaxID=399 RepID=UPI000621C60D|nr:IS6 family transposase [Neorhizobium galegae]CDZ64626.1 ISRh1 transposase-like protein [Neorhizobium galegae bv. orientalis]MCQ1575110.1 IS6 family transposase [Neorhizobium galegae]MCQ1810764.1 IS6 family transposase [Neorhizobium galegae]MCQ1839419.1 IS6 family transposase [Neorhizobium galegae]UIY32597.1 IS6 family transposase [Neorhizobium galegae]
MKDRDPLYRRHRFPAEIIAQALWLYFRFPLSLRMVEDILAARGIIVSHQTVRLWAEKFGRTFANEIRRRSAGRLGDKWHLDEAVVSIRGKKHWPWRAVDQDGFVMEVLVQNHRNAKSAKRLMRKLLKGQGRTPRVMITDKLRSYDAAKREIMPSVEHRSHKGLNNRAKNSHQPFRRRERIMKRFKSQRHLQRHLQRFASIHDPIASLLHIPRHDISSSHHRELRSEAINPLGKSRSRLNRHGASGLRLPRER